MMQYITEDEHGTITAVANWQFEGSSASPKPVIRGWDGGLYVADDPRAVKPASVLTAERSAAVRAERDRRISATDYLMALDYPLTEAEREPWKAYRQALRDLPEQAGFPWAGGGADDAECPWPVEPLA